MQRHPIGAFCKRALDFVVAACGLILLSPLLLVIALAIRLTMGAPVFFRQVRPGYHGRPFTVVKFRTMSGDVPAIVDTSQDAVRLTKLGKILACGEPRRAPTAMERADRRHELGGPASLADGISGALLAGASAAS